MSISKGRGSHTNIRMVGLLVLLISKLPFLSKLYFHLNIALSNHFADKAAQIAIKENVDAIIVYDGISKKVLNISKHKLLKLQQ